MDKARSWTLLHSRTKYVQVVVEPLPEYRVQDGNFRIHDSRFRVQGSRFRVHGSEFRIQGSKCRVQGSRFRVQGSGSRVPNSGFRAQGWFDHTEDPEHPLFRLITLPVRLRSLRNLTQGAIRPASPARGARRLLAAPELVRNILKIARKVGIRLLRKGIQAAMAQKVRLRDSSR